MFGFFKCFASPEIKVSATVDRTEVSLDEFVQFTITVEGIDDSYRNPQIKLPQLEENFSIVGTAQSNRINLQGGKAEAIWQMQYTLSAKKEGEIKIESAEVIYKGRTYETKDLVITITPAKNPQKQPRKQTIPKKVPWSDKEGTFI